MNFLDIFLTSKIAEFLPLFLFIEKSDSLLFSFLRLNTLKRKLLGNLYIVR